MCVCGGVGSGGGGGGGGGVWYTHRKQSPLNDVHGICVHFMQTEVIVCVCRTIYTHIYYIIVLTS